MRELRGKIRHSPRGSSIIQDASPRKNLIGNTTLRHNIEITVQKSPEHNIQQAKGLLVEWIHCLHLVKHLMSNHEINTTQQAT